jgi:hypothetical protein
MRYRTEPLAVGVELADGGTVYRSSAWSRRRTRAHSATSRTVGA